MSVRDATREILRVNGGPITSVEDLESEDRARSLWATFRRQNGKVRNGRRDYLTAPQDNVKLSKGDVPTFGLSLAPSGLSGWQVCRWRTAQCDPLSKLEGGCLASAGKGGLEDVRAGRSIRTRFMVAHPRAALRLVVAEVDRAVRKHGAIGLRLNVLSDIPWHEVAPFLFSLWGDAVTLYDYTKDHRRGDVEGWHLTLSASERTSVADVRRATEAGRSVTVVVGGLRKKETAPSDWHGMPTVDGDVSDARWQDPDGSVVLLRAKGDMRGQAVGLGEFVKPL